MDILGPLSGVLAALPAAAPPPLNMCLMPFGAWPNSVSQSADSLQQGRAVAAAPPVEIAQKLQTSSKRHRACRRTRRAVARVTASARLDEAAKFIQQFSKKGAFAKLLSARSTRGSSAPRQATRNSASSARRWTSAARAPGAAVREDRGLDPASGPADGRREQPGGAAGSDRRHRRAARRDEEFSALGLKLDQIAADMSTSWPGPATRERGGASAVYDSYDWTTRTRRRSWARAPSARLLDEARTTASFTPSSSSR